VVLSEGICMAPGMRLLARIAGRAMRLLPHSHLGVRGLVVDRRDGGTDHVLLVRHTYVDGWYLPGGGIEAGESAQTALARELIEETGVEILGLPLLHGTQAQSRNRGSAVFTDQCAAVGSEPGHPRPDRRSPARRVNLRAVVK